ncbi:MAG: MmcQ/YjbR family DNA-binding protein [Oscillospiraceae bacterium]|nr:MmcQ/YjbR family DNA-binding protein [Oscillospiraceae bacterium]
MDNIKKTILEYARDNLGTEPEKPWRKYPGYIVLRHDNNKKWYAVIMTVDKDKLGIKGDGTAEIINVKCDPVMVDSLQKNDGYFPAYHMNKSHWVSIILDGTVPKDEILNFVSISFDITAKKYPKSKKER